MLRLIAMDVDAHGGSWDRQRVVAWVATSIIPHEPAVRAWLRSRLRSQDDVDDLVQEAYAKLAGLTSVDQIANPRGYFFQVVRNLLIDHVRRERIVQIEVVADLEQVGGFDQSPGPDRIVSARRELSRVAALLESLPERCRQIFTMRKVEGLTQKEIATRLGVTESVVENDGVKGMRMILAGLKGETSSGEAGEEAE